MIRKALLFGFGTSDSAKDVTDLGDHLLQCGNDNLEVLQFILLKEDAARMDEGLEYTFSHFLAKGSPANALAPLPPGMVVRTRATSSPPPSELVQREGAVFIYLASEIEQDMSSFRQRCLKLPWANVLVALDCCGASQVLNAGGKRKGKGGGKRKNKGKGQKKKKKGGKEDEEEKEDCRAFVAAPCATHDCAAEARAAPPEPRRRITPAIIQWFEAASKDRTDNGDAPDVGAGADAPADAGAGVEGNVDADVPIAEPHSFGHTAHQFCEEVVKLHSSIHGGGGDDITEQQQPAVELVGDDFLLRYNGGAAINNSSAIDGLDIDAVHSVAIGNGQEGRGVANGGVVVGWGGGSKKGKRKDTKKKKKKPSGGFGGLDTKLSCWVNGTPKEDDVIRIVE